MEQVVAKSTAQTSFIMLLLLISASIALGAQAGEVARLIVGQSLRLALIGVVGGLLASLAGLSLRSG